MKYNICYCILFKNRSIICMNAMAKNETQIVVVIKKEKLTSFDSAESNDQRSHLFISPGNIVKRFVLASIIIFLFFIHLPIYLLLLFHFFNSSYFCSCYLLLCFNLFYPFLFFIFSFVRVRFVYVTQYNSERQTHTSRK